MPLFFSTVVAGEGAAVIVCRIFFAVGTVYADLETASLCVTEIGAATHFKVFLLTGRPCFDVDGFYLEVCKVAGAAFESTNGDVERTEEINGVLPELFIPHHAVFGLTYNNHFLLFELMDSVNASFFDAVSTLFLTETG